MVKFDLIRFCHLVDQAEHQGDILIGLYKMVFPDWDNFEKLEGWPSINNKTYDLIANVFHQFDKLNHPEVIAGGLWMNMGFSIDDSVPDWEFDDSTCQSIYKEVPSDWRIVI